MFSVTVSVMRVWIRQTCVFPYKDARRLFADYINKNVTFPTVPDEMTIVFFFINKCLPDSMHDMRIFANRRRVAGSRHLVCGNCASWIQHENSGCEKK